jgi:hypothetical protein
MGREVRFDEKAETVTAIWESETRKTLKEAAKTAGRDFEGFGLY